MPDLIRYYLHEEPILANIDTWRLEEDEAREEVLDRLEELVVKPVDGSGGKGIVIGPRATTAELDALRRRVTEDPRGWIAQPVVQLSTVPTLIDDALEPRHVDLRPFAVNSGDDIWVLPGGLTRVALPEGELVVNSSQGGGSKDTWVLVASAAEPADGSRAPRRGEWWRLTPSTRLVDPVTVAEPSTPEPRPRSRRPRSRRPARSTADPVDARGPASPSVVPMTVGIPLGGLGGRRPQQEQQQEQQQQQQQQQQQDPAMLSRIAESMFWIGRYIERSEDTARLLQTHLRMLGEGTASGEADACREPARVDERRQHRGADGPTTCCGCSATT